MKYYDLYGIRDMSTNDLQHAVGSAIQLSFRRRHSGEIGTYYKAELDDEIFAIESNFQDERNEDEILEPEFADFPVLLRVSRTQRGDELRDMLLEIPGLEHLRRDTRD
jgi:hypothetical protein